ncbi:MAG: MFS transporter [Devosia sp.]
MRRANPFGAILALRQYPVVIWLLGVLFMFSLAAQAYPSVFNYFAIEVFGFSSSQIGRALGAFGIGFAICQALLVGPAVKKVGESPVVIAGMLAAAAAFTGMAFTTSQTWLYVYLLMGAFAGLAAPAINGVLSREVPDNAQGELQGAVNAANSLATIIGPLAATQIFSLFTHHDTQLPYFPGAPFIAAGALLVGAVAVFGFVALRYDFAHKAPVAKKPVVPEMAPPGQIHIPTEVDEDDDESGDGTANEGDRSPPSSPRR